MNAATIERAVRRGQLIERSAQLRQRLAEHSLGVARVCAVADRVGDGAQQVRAHPEWVFGGVLALVALKPRRIWRWGRVALVGWRTWIALRRRLPAVFGAPRT